MSTPNLKKYALTIIPHIIVLLGIILIVLLTLGNGQRGLMNATYTRFEVCALDVPADVRTKADINRCWGLAEKSTGITVKHFSKE